MYLPKPTHRMLFAALLLTAAALSALAEDSAPSYSTVRFKNLPQVQPVRGTGELTVYDDVDPTGHAPRPPLNLGGSSSRRRAQSESISASNAPSAAASAAPSVDSSPAVSAAPRRLPEPLPQLQVQPVSHSPTVRDNGDVPAPIQPPPAHPAIENSTAPCQDCAPRHVRHDRSCGDGGCGFPFGMCVRSTLGMQVTAGWVGQTVLYRYDFCDGIPGSDGRQTAAEQLNPHGERQLQKIAGWWGFLPEPRLVIQPSGNIELDAMRRKAVVLRMSQIWGTSIPADVVLTAYPDVPGTSGTEAVIQYENLLRQTEAGPQPHADSGTSGGGSGISIGTQQATGQ